MAQPPRAAPSAVIAALDDVASTVRQGMPETRSELERLVRIPSVSAFGHDPSEVRRSAEAAAELLRSAGLDEVRLLEIAGAHPYTYGEWLGAGPSAPSVLLYAHHDVQPVASPDRWASPPFEPTERDGRLFARGAADDKAGVLVHVAAVRAWLERRGSLPLNVKVIIEGEEEIGSPHLAEFLDAHAATLHADVIVLTDVTNWKVGWPAITYSLRGLAVLDVSVRAQEQPLHSGMWGGPVPDALMGLARLLATLHDDQGRPAVAGFLDGLREPTASERERLGALGADPEALRAEARMLEGVEFLGDPDVSLLERLWARPTINVDALDAPSIADAAPQLAASARARLSLRVGPGQDPDHLVAALTEHLHARAPWGMQVGVEPVVAVGAWVTEPSGPAFAAAEAAMAAAYGREPALIGCGGTIPFVAPFSAAFGGAPCLLTGIEDPATNAHGEDESLHLGDFEKACLAEAYLFAELADRLGGSDGG